jgi:CRISPR system Cascade subunit CasD
MTDYLLFQLYGPLAAWGDTAVGEFRPSQAHPGRTAVLGLVAAALGIRRPQPHTDDPSERDLTELDRALRVAVRLDAPGEVLRDYHTTQVPSQERKVRHYTRRDELRDPGKLNTILSQRDYRTDAAVTVALQQRASDVAFDLSQIAQALRQPVFTLYLGRKACPPALPLNPQLIIADDLKTAFDRYDSPLVQLGELLGLVGSPLPTTDGTRYFWGDDPNPGMNPQMQYPRRDQLRSRQRWQFDNRTEYTATIATAPISTEDA